MKKILVKTKSASTYTIYGDDVTIVSDEFIEIPHEMLKAVCTGTSEEDLDYVIILQEDYNGLNKGKTFSLKDIVSFDSESRREYLKVQRKFMEAQMEAANELFGFDLNYFIDTLGDIDQEAEFTDIVLSRKG